MDRAQQLSIDSALTADSVDRVAQLGSSAGSDLNDQLVVHERRDLVGHVDVPRVVGVDTVFADEVWPTGEPVFGDWVDEYRANQAGQVAQGVAYSAIPPKAVLESAKAGRSPENLAAGAVSRACRRVAAARATNVTGSTGSSLREPKNTTRASSGRTTRVARS